MAFTTMRISCYPNNGGLRRLIHETTSMVSENDKKWLNRHTNWLTWISIYINKHYTSTSISE